MKLIATYARVSTSNQEKQETIENQTNSLRKFAAENDLKIIREYKDDGWSGSMLERPGLDQLRKDARNKLWQAVLIYDPDRLARSYSRQGTVMDELHDLEIEVIFVTLPTPKNEKERMMYQLMYGMRSFFAEFEREKISERFMQGKLNKIEQGHIVTSQASYGHRYIPNVVVAGKVVKHGEYVIEPEEARNLNNIFHWIDKEGLSLRQVVTRLYEQGIKPRKSTRGVWTNGTLITLLNNKALIGEAHYGRSYAVVPKNPQNKKAFKKYKKSSRKNKPESEWIANAIKVPPIIDRELFFRVHERLKINFALLQMNKKNEYLLSNKIWCVCGCKRAGEGPMHGKHLYYRCSNRVYNYPLPRTCFEKGINARIADKLVWMKFVEMVSSPQLLIDQLNRFLESRKNGEESSIDNVDELKRKISKLKSQAKRLAMAFANETITEKLLGECLEPIKEQIAGLECRVNEAQAKRIILDKIEIPTKEQLAALTRKASEFLNNLNFETKRAIIMSVIEKIAGSQKQLQVAGYIPLKETYYQNVVLKTECGHRGPAQRGQIHIIQSHHQKTG